MAPLSDLEIRACKHPRLTLRFALALICALLLVPVLAAFAAFGAVTLLLFWLIGFIWLSTEVWFAYFTDNMILVSEYNYPRIKTLADEMKALLGVRKEFKVFVYQMGEFNAFMVRMFRRRAIFLNSEILETGVSDNEVRWIAGRFVGYWRCQQDAGVWGWLIRVAERFIVFTLLMLPYERAMVYTGDRLGLAGIGGDIASAISAMQKLLVGRQLGYSVNPIGVVEQRRQTKGSLFAFLARMTSGFPSTIARYVDLMAFARRQYRDAFGRFEAANPGLSSDLNSLSGERTSARSIGKGLGFLALIALAAALTFLAWTSFAYLLVKWMPDRFSPQPAYEYSPPPAAPPETGYTPPPAPAEAPAPSDNGAGGAPPADGTAPPAAADGHAIPDPVIAQQPSAADFDRVYPEAARNAGTTGSGTIRCSVTADGSLANCEAVSETPEGSGFGAAAVQLQDVIKIAPQSRSGAAVAGGIVSLDVPFTLPAAPAQ